MSVKQVTAFKDSLGRYHERELDAVRAEAELKITQFFGSNHIEAKQVSAIVCNAEGIIRALQPVVNAMHATEGKGDE